MIPLYDTIPSSRPPLVNYVLIGINVLVFLVEVALPEDILNRLIHNYGVIPLRYTDPQWAASTGMGVSLVPLFTSMFLHGGWVHLIGNMWTLWIFGDNVEDRMGHWRFLLFYLLCGLIAIFTHIALYPNSEVPTIGASGAISGVMGAYMFLFPGSRVITLVPIFFFLHMMEVPAFFYLGVWFVGQLISGMTSLALGDAVGIAFWAHIGGFVGGALFRKVFVPGEARPPHDYEVVRHNGKIILIKRQK